MNRPLNESTTVPSAVALVTPVGGNWQGPLAAMRGARPRRVIFLVSSQTEPFMRQIRDQYTDPLLDVDWITTPDHESVSETLRVLNSHLPAVLLKWHIEWEDVIVDLTGGTKAMVAALMLATIHKAKNFMYVGGEARGSGGTGTVLTGRERPVRFFNPWDETAEDARRQIYWAFNNLQFGTAADLAQKAGRMASGENKSYLTWLGELIEGFGAWDRFDYKQALGRLEKAKVGLMFAWPHMDGHGPLVKQLEQSIEWLESLDDARSDGIPTIRFLQDLLGNAWRRGEVEQKYDDAVARLYRFVEGLAQQSLWESFKLRTGKIPVDSLPSGAEWDDLREEARKEGKETIELGLAKCYALLKALGHPLGSVVIRLGQKGDLGKLLCTRNQSLLAHGINPVAPQHFSGLFKICLEISGFGEADLVQFLRLPE